MMKLGKHLIWHIQEDGSIYRNSSVWIDFGKYIGYL